MAISSFSRLAAVIITIAVASLWGASAHADPITVDWDVVPHEHHDTSDDHSPYYECVGTDFTNRRCHSLWDTGLALEAVLHSFYDDKFFDLVGFEWGDVWRIRPVCKPTLGPCFDLFTPVTLRMDGPSMGAAVNLSITSSRGGIIRIPEIDLLPHGAVVEFSGDEWADLEWLQIGVYIPDECESAGFPDEPHACDFGHEHALQLRELTFEPVPEPPIVWLLGAAAAGFGARSRLGRKR